MGNSQQVARKVLETPLPEDALGSVVANMQESTVKSWVSTLMAGSIPTNFNYDDICSTLSQFTNDQFVILPVWTLHMRNTATSATCLVNNWPSWTDEQLASPSFLSSVRVMFPLFKTGHPIGHARFMFYDNWSPMPTASIAQEQEQWLQVVQEVIPVEEVARLIVVDYEGLCPSRAQGGQHGLKIIDSLPGSIRAFQQDVRDFEEVIDCVSDPTWSPPARKDVDRKLHCARTFLSAVYARFGSRCSPLDETDWVGMHHYLLMQGDCHVGSTGSYSVAQLYHLV